MPFAVKLEIWAFLLAVGCSSVAVGNLDAIALGHVPVLTHSSEKKTAPEPFCTGAVLIISVGSID
jgi:hypothetical protein